MRGVQQGFMDIQTYMTKKKLRDGDMAELLDCNKTTVWRIRTGDTYPSPDLLEKIFEVTGGKVTANDFFHQKETKHG